LKKTAPSLSKRRELLKQPPIPEDSNSRNFMKFETGNFTNIRVSKQIFIKIGKTVRILHIYMREAQTFTARKKKANLLNIWEFLRVKPVDMKPT
jgi:hypothetical protein